MPTAKSQKTFAFVVYPQIRLLDLVASYSMLIGLTMNGGYQNVIVGEHAEPIASDTPLSILPAKTFAQVPHPSAVMILGGDVSALNVLGNDAVMDYVRGAAEQAEMIIAMDSGTLILAALGLLDGKTATTHWTCAHLLEKFGVRYVRQSWVEDGKFITTAGVSAGLDLGLDLVDKRKGRGLAGMLQMNAEYDPEPPFGKIEWTRANASASQQMNAAQRDTLRAALAHRPELAHKLFGVSGG